MSLGPSPGSRHTLCTLRSARIFEFSASQKLGRLMECQSHRGFMSIRAHHFSYTDLN